MEQVILTSTVPNFVEVMLMLPLIVLGDIGAFVKQTLTCGPAEFLFILIAVLGIPTGIMYDGLTGVLMLAGGAVEVFVVTWLCQGPTLPNLIEAAMLAIKPEVLLAAFAKA